MAKNFDEEDAETDPIEESSDDGDLDSDEKKEDDWNEEF